MANYQIIPPTIYFKDRELWLLNAELNNFTLEQLMFIVTDFENIFSGKYEASSFGLEAINVSFNKEKAVIDHYGEILTEVNSVDIYVALKDYVMKLQVWNQIIRDSSLAPAIPRT